MIKHRFSPARAALLLGAGLSFATPVLAQNAVLDAAATDAATAPLRAALSAGKTPLTLAVSALDGSWRRFKPSAATNKNSVASSDTLDETTSFSSFVTRGETLSVGAETFLIAYRGQTDFDKMPLDLQEDLRIELEQTGQGIETPDGYARLLSSQKLQLCLLNVRTVGDLTDIRAFDSQSDLIVILSSAERENMTKQADEQAIQERAQLGAQAANTRVTTDLKQIGLALLQYTQDYDEKLPPMRSSQSMADIKKIDVYGMKQGTVQQVLGPYMNSQDIFAHPTTREIYRPNPNISGRSLASLSTSPKQIITFYEASPAPNGTRAVLYLDGHVRREPETAWANIQAVSARFAPPLKPGKRTLTNSSATPTVTLTDAAATTYQIKQWKKNPKNTQTLYLSNSTNRVYYRDDKTHQAIWVDAPVKGITLSAKQAAPFRDYKGYNGQKKGRVLSDDFKIS